MPVAIVMEFEGATLDQYNQIVEKMGLEPGGDTPPGALFHWVTESDDGILVTDVWETREQFDAFADAQIGPFSQEVGIPNPPRTTFHGVHNHLIRGG